MATDPSSSSSRLAARPPSIDGARTPTLSHRPSTAMSGTETYRSARQSTEYGWSDADVEHYLPASSSLSLAHATHAVTGARRDSADNAGASSLPTDPSATTEDRSRTTSGATRSDAARGSTSRDEVEMGNDTFGANGSATRIVDERSDGEGEVRGFLEIPSGSIGVLGALGEANDDDGGERMAKSLSHRTLRASPAPVGEAPPSVTTSTTSSPHPLHPYAHRSSSSDRPASHHGTASFARDLEASGTTASVVPTARRPAETVQETPVQHRALQHATVLSLLAFASIWGTLTREGLVALNTYSGQSVAPLVWAQAVGCLIMGWATGKNKATLEQWSLPIYTMITTGYCGSVTTFSSWMLEVFRAFGDQRHYGRGGLHNVMDALSQTFVTLGMSLVSLYAGRKLSVLLDLAVVDRLLQRRWEGGGGEAPDAEERGAYRPDRLEGKEGDGPTTHPATVRPQATRRVRFNAALLPLGVAFWIGAALLCALYEPYRHVTFALILSPPGAATRWYLSRLNARPISSRLSTPLGTLTANLLATAVLCASFVSQRYGTASDAGGRTGTGLGRNACWALYGLQEGFCGCLSTVSTLVVELDAFRGRRAGWRASRYMGISWAAGIVVCVIIVGAPWWSTGLEGRCVGLTL